MQKRFIKALVLLMVISPMASAKTSQESPPQKCTLIQISPDGEKVFLHFNENLEQGKPMIKKILLVDANERTNPEFSMAINGSGKDTKIKYELKIGDEVMSDTFSPFTHDFKVIDKEKGYWLNCSNF
jgi:hypothetical protein